MKTKKQKRVIAIGRKRRSTLWTGWATAQWGTEWALPSRDKYPTLRVINPSLQNHMLRLPQWYLALQSHLETQKTCPSPPSLTYTTTISFVSLVISHLEGLVVDKQNGIKATQDVYPRGGWEGVLSILHGSILGETQVNFCILAQHSGWPCELRWMLFGDVGVLTVWRVTVGYHWLQRLQPLPLQGSPPWRFIRTFRWRHWYVTFLTSPFTISHQQIQQPARMPPTRSTASTDMKSLRSLLTSVLSLVEL